MEVFMPGKKIPEDRRREQILQAAYRIALKQKLAGLSTRAVAAEAGISNGLVFFHFRNRQDLLLALLDWLLTETILRRAVDYGVASGDALSRLAAEVRGAVEGLYRDRDRIELFFDYWFSGPRDEAIRKRIRTALNQYRNSYLPLARAVVAEQPARYHGISAETLADLVTSFIEGCALRLVAKPKHFDIQSYADAVTAMLML
jgi:AcrR family transcriptional regulator